MTIKQLIVFCLVDGEAALNAFSIEIDSTKTVDSLRDAIKAKKSNQFSEVDADQLALYHVNIPIAVNDDDEEGTPILLDNISKPDINKLVATNKLTDVFHATLPDNSIHIIIRPTTSRPSGK
ncbi:hypothetical protein BGZ76_004035 [Entomortierella beljakovae]|nr:hypothetical protein BGZ76_004035 [Entomortierella beljakovae]